MNGARRSSRGALRRSGHAAAWARAMLALAFSAVPAAAFNVTGTVFEDVNYGGGAGRSMGASAGVTRSGARVELFDNSGSFVSFTTTNASGAYAFNGLANGTYTVRVVNGSVTSSRTGYVAGLLPVQTYRTNASTGAAMALTDRVGGEVPSKVDAGNGSSTLAALTNAAMAPQSITTVTSAGPDVPGVDFGFNFDTIVNVNDTGQGTLRQYVLNTNALGNAGLAIQGQPAGRDVSVFMISDGLAHPGLRAGIADLLSGSGVAVITVASVLPAVTAAATSIDGSTQTANVGNTNASTLGAGGTVGVDALALNPVAGPEVELRAGGSMASGVLIQGDNGIVRGMSIYGFGTGAGEAGVRVDTGISGALIENNVLGATASSFTDPGASLRNYAGVYCESAVNGTIRYNLVGFSRVTGLYLSSSTGWTLLGNEIRDTGDTQDADGITLNTSSTNTVTGNRITGTSSQGIVVTVAPSSSNTFTNNTVTGNGVGIPSGIAQSTGITMRTGATSTVLDRNVIAANYGAGLQINSGSSGTRVTHNSFANNGTITARNGNGPTGQIGIDLNSAGDNADFGTAPFVTLNDNGDADAGGNGLLNFPILVSASVLGGNLIVRGFARPGSVIELFIANADPSGFGEGETYLLTLTEGGTGAGGNDPYADTDAGAGTYGPGAINGIAQGTDNTNRFTFTFPLPPGVAVGTALTSTATLANETSEFSGNVAVTGAIGGTVFEDVNYGGGAGRSLAAASGVARSAARVELYGAVGGFVTFTTTDASGNYLFSGLASGNYTVRVVNSTVSSSRGGYVAGLMPVQTFRTDAGSGSVAAVTDHVGGQNPAVADAGNGGAGATMNTATGVFTAGVVGTAQSITNVALGGGGAAGVDFGYHFDCFVNRNDSGQGSLRQCLLNANALANAGLAQVGRPAGIDNVICMLADGTPRPGLSASYASQFTAGVASIALTSALPAVSSPAVIDAQTQPGWTSAPIVEVGGAGAGAGAIGFSLTAGQTTVRGLTINRFASHGIAVSAAGVDTISGCWIGLNATGTAAAANGGHGIAITGAPSNVVGGTTPTARNVISGNAQNGVSILGAAATGNRVLGNVIGLDATGTSAVANQDGVVVDGGATGNTIGGIVAGAGNVITASFQYGVVIASAGTRQNAVLENSIYGNGSIGITLNFDAVTPNNGTKNAALPNDDMDFPVFTSAILAGGSLTVTGYVGSAPGQATFGGARVEVFQSDNDASGFGEGRTFLGFLTANASGNFSGALAAPGLVIGDQITATATDASNNTSEFGPQHSTDPLTIVKRAFQLDGAPIPNGTVVAKGAVFKFLLYISNPGPAVSDVSLRDVLDPSFTYLGGTLLSDNTQPACASGTCTPGEEASILAATNVGTVGTDALDGDTVSRSGATIDVGNQNVANAPLNLAAGRVYAIEFTVRMN